MKSSKKSEILSIPEYQYAPSVNLLGPSTAGKRTVCCRREKHYSATLRSFKGHRCKSALKVMCGRERECAIENEDVDSGML